jgi:hypothetical protein
MCGDDDDIGDMGDMGDIGGCGTARLVIISVPPALISSLLIE